MGNEYDDIAIGLARALDEKNRNLEAHIQAHIERSLGRALLKVGIVGLISACATVGGVVVAVTHYVDRMDKSIELQQKQIDGLDTTTVRHEAHLASVEHTAIDAKTEAGNANAWIAGHSAQQQGTRR